MKAPEKIYIPRLEGNEIFVHEWSATKFRKYFSIEIAENVEYIRTDAFIEKACEYWYQYNRNMVKKHGAKAVLGCSEFTVNVEGFKKYMEGELNAEKIEIDLLNGVALTEDMLASLAKKVF